MIWPRYPPRIRRQLRQDPELARLMARNNREYLGLDHWFDFRLQFTGESLNLIVV